MILEILLLWCICSLHNYIVILPFTSLCKICNQIYSSSVIKTEILSMTCEYFIKQTVSYLVENTLFPRGQDIRIIWFCEEETHRTWAFAKNKDSFNSSWSSSKAACLITAFCIILSCLCLTYNFTDKIELFYTCI